MYDQQSDSGATSPPDGGSPPVKIYTSQRGCIILLGLLLLFWVLALGTCYKTCYGR